MITRTDNRTVRCAHPGCQALGSHFWAREHNHIAARLAGMDPLHNGPETSHLYCRDHFQAHRPVMLAVTTGRQLLAAQALVDRFGYITLPEAIDYVETVVESFTEGKP